MVFCSQCGAALTAQANFCPSCGTRAAPTAVIPTTAPPMVTPAEERWQVEPVHPVSHHASVAPSPSMEVALQSEPLAPSGIVRPATPQDAAAVLAFFRGQQRIVRIVAILSIAWSMVALTPFDGGAYVFMGGFLLILSWIVTVLVWTARRIASKMVAGPVHLAQGDLSVRRRPLTNTSEVSVGAVSFVVQNRFARDLGPTRHVTVEYFLAAKTRRLGTPAYLLSIDGRPFDQARPMGFLPKRGGNA